MVEPEGGAAREALDEVAVDEDLAAVGVFAQRTKFRPNPIGITAVQLRGIEGVRVRKSYELLAQQYGVPWKRRAYDVQDWEAGDVPNRCLSSATSCLHGLTEAAVLAASPAEDARRGGDDLAVLFYTGGTTGRSKGVMLSHANCHINSYKWLI